MKLTPLDIQRFAQGSVLCWLATQDAEGYPSVSPKEIFRLLPDGRVIIANIASAGSRRNLLANPKVCVTLLDVMLQKGCKLKGQARLIRAADPDFEVLHEPLKALAGEAFSIHEIFEVCVEHHEEILAPSYRRDPAPTEVDKVRESLQQYTALAMSHLATSADVKPSSNANANSNSPLNANVPRGAHLAPRSDVDTAFFAEKLRLHTDAWDVAETLRSGQDIVVVDCRARQAYLDGHIPGAISLPHREMAPETTAQFDRHKLYITYCDGIGCNASTKGAYKLAQLGFRVQEMLGGLDFWIRDLHPVVTGPEAGQLDRSTSTLSCAC